MEYRLLPELRQPQDEVADAVDSALQFLAQHQQDYGEIAAYRFFNPQLEGECWLDSSPFTTTFALHALTFIAHPTAMAIRQRAARFLLESMDDNGLWRYWTRRSGLPIDPDLDDTCCVSYALQCAFGPASCVPDNVAQILANRHEGGMFKTWLRPTDAANDIDYVVNANVLLYLGDRPETTDASAALVQLINSHPQANGSHYYLSPLALYYAIARASEHRAKSLLVCRTMIIAQLERDQQEDGSWGDPMNTALAICSLAALAATASPVFTHGLCYLLRSQNENGGFARSAFYAGPEPPTPHSVYWGSEELTTVLCLEAFGRYQRFHSAQGVAHG